MPLISVNLDVSQQVRNLKQMRAALNTGTAEIKTMVKQWAARYRTYSQKRFIEQSAGGGDWPPLKRARKRGSLESALILRDTGLMLGALNPVFTGAPGQLEELDGSHPIGIRVGFGGGAAYQTGARVADVSEYHQTGAGNLPVREILVQPDSQTLQGMEKDADRAIGKMVARINNPNRM